MTLRVTRSFLDEVPMVIENIPNGVFRRDAIFVHVVIVGRVLSGVVVIIHGRRISWNHI